MFKLPFNLKRKLSFILTIALFITYYISTDPDSTFLSDLPFGISLVLVTNVFMVAIVGILLIEFIPDYYIDEIYGKESKLRENAETSDIGSGYVLIAKSLRILAYAIIVAASIIAYNLG